jgi:hypothetical protein
MSILLVGDMHVVPNELDDCQALMDLIYDTVKGSSKFWPGDFIRNIVFLGDQHNNHDILNVRVIDFWKRNLKRLNNVFVTMLVGNHDQLTPTIRNPHSLIPYSDLEHVKIVDCPQSVACTGSSAMPYYASPEEFIKDACKLSENLNSEILFCHQTFSGVENELGFHLDEAIAPSAIPFNFIISGHIHKPMKFGKVWYVGSPRWRTLSDADVDKRAIWILRDAGNAEPIFTNNICTRIYRLEDSEEKPVSFDGINFAKADIRVSVVGSATYVSNRINNLKKDYNIKCRGVITKNRLVKIKESEGIEVAFKRYFDEYKPPYETDKQILLKELNERIKK